MSKSRFQVSSSKLQSRYIIGIDEVGRGALAGKVFVAAVALRKNLKLKAWNLKLRDSKKLTPKQRGVWFDYIKAEKIYYALASVPPKTIDKINISQAANLAATKAFNKLIAKCKMRGTNYKACLDGGLFLPKNLNSKFLILNSITRGDEKIPAISLASIVAKVSRDKEMVKFHKKYPKYKFHKHKGYGTKEHFKAIKKYGPSKIHRLTFLKKVR